MSDQTTTTTTKSTTTLWEEFTHKAIVEKAIELMRAYSTNGSNPHAKNFFDIFYTADDRGVKFINSLLQGLKDADDKEPWKDNDRWYRHFYNPQTRKNYRGDPNINAYSEGLRYFKLSEHYANRIVYFTRRNQTVNKQLYINAGYFLGLSLHFFTDLTQPMHAANFSSVYGKEGDYPYGIGADFRHSGFEVYTDNEIRRGLFNNLRSLNDGDLAPFKDNYVGNYIHEIALKSKTVFDESFKNILEQKILRQYRGFEIVAESYWRSYEADPLIQRSTVFAPYYVANYLTNWVLLSQLKPNYVSTKWYQILEPTNAPANHNDLDKFEVSDLSKTAGKWMQRWKNFKTDNQKFYLMYNADGTVCIGCKDGKKSIWMIAERDAIAWVGQSDKIERATRFRISTYNEKKVLFFESTRNEVVHVHTGVTGINRIDLSNRGFYLRWSPAHDNNQWFILHETEDISMGDITEIKTHYPDFLKYDWAGDPNVVPTWEEEIPKDVVKPDLLAELEELKNPSN